MVLLIFQTLAIILALAPMISVLAATARTVSCAMFNDDAVACSRAISSVTNLFCHYVDGVKACVDTAACATCFAPSGGECALTHVFVWRNNNCSDSSCSSFYTGWNNEACLVFLGGGVCGNTGCANESEIAIAAPATRVSLCSVLNKSTLSSCGSTACRRVDRCLSGAATLPAPGNDNAAFYCYQKGQQLCDSGFHCDMSGTCVADSLCLAIDRPSDCALVVDPVSIRQCVETPYGCDLSRTSTAAAKNDTDCGGIMEKNSCEDASCARNQGRCVWVDYRPSSPGFGICTCPLDCPPCSAMINGQCMYNCTASDGCTSWSCPRAFVQSSTSCFKPAFNATPQVALGLDEHGNCVCHISRRGGCDQGESCDDNGDCARSTLCERALSENVCKMLTCDRTGVVAACVWNGDSCQCAGVATASNLTPTPFGVIPVYKQSLRISDIPCDFSNCPALKNVDGFYYSAANNFGPSFVSINKCTHGNEQIDCCKIDSQLQDLPVISLRLHEPSTVVSVSVYGQWIGCIIPDIFVIQSGKITTVPHSPVNSYNTGTQIWIVYNFITPVHAIEQLFIRYRNVFPSSINFRAFRIMGFSPSTPSLTSNTISSLTSSTSVSFIMTPTTASSTAVATTSTAADSSARSSKSATTTLSSAATTLQQNLTESSTSLASTTNATMHVTSTSSLNSASTSTTTIDPSHSMPSVNDTLSKPQTAPIGTLPNSDWRIILALIVCALVITFLVIITIRGCIIWWRKHKTRLMTKHEDLPVNDDDDDDEIQSNSSGLLMQTRKHGNKPSFERL